MTASGTATGSTLTCRCDPEMRGPCGESAVAVTTAICVHEHLRDEVPHCAEHAARVHDTVMVCVTCYRSSEPHECPVRVIDQRLLGADQ